MGREKPDCMILSFWNLSSRKGKIKYSVTIGSKIQKNSLLHSSHIFSPNNPCSSSIRIYHVTLRPTWSLPLNPMLFCFLSVSILTTATPAQATSVLCENNYDQVGPILPALPPFSMLQPRQSCEREIYSCGFPTPNPTTR